MKKLLAILAVAGVMSACNNGDTSSSTTDSTKTDSTTMSAPATTAPAQTDTSMHMSADSGMNKMDTTKSKTVTKTTTKTKN